MNDYLPVSHEHSSQGQQYQQPSNLEGHNYNQRQFTEENSQQPNQYEQPYPHHLNPQLLGESQVHHINKQIDFVEKDINDNYAEIRNLKNKITKSDLDHAHLKKLHEKQLILQEKQKQLEQVLASHEYMKQELQKSKIMDSQLRHSLGNQYQSIVEERKRHERQEREREIQLEAEMINYNQQALSYDQKRKRDFLEQQKRQAQEDLRQRQLKKQQQKMEKERQKIEYNRKVSQRNQLQTQKDQVYKQYYNHFNEQQQKLQTIYRNKAMPGEIMKEQERRKKQARQIEGFQERMARENQIKLRKMMEEKQALRNYLRSQMEENNRKKNRQREDETAYQNQVKQYQVSQSQYQLSERYKKRQEQKRYDEELATQIQIRNKSNYNGFGTRSNSLGGHNGLNASNGSFGEERRTHNPVTNPIDFKMGITNPYVIKQYENTKEKYMGDGHLKLKNLAMIGNNSLVNHHTQRN